MCRCYTGLMACQVAGIDAVIGCERREIHHSEKNAGGCAGSHFGHSRGKLANALGEAPVRLPACCRVSGQRLQSAAIDLSRRAAFTGNVNRHDGQMTSSRKTPTSPGAGARRELSKTLQENPVERRNFKGRAIFGEAHYE